MAENKKEINGAIIGLGGLGCPALISLIESWTNNNQNLTLKLIDNDIVSLSNLNRQILYSSSACGKRKIDAAITGLNSYFNEIPSYLNLETYFEKITANNIKKLLTECDFILDCTDDIETKLLLNIFAINYKKILIYAGVQGFNGTVLPIIPGGPCLNCVFGEFSNEEACQLGGACRSGGVLGSIAGITAITQVKELLAYLEKSDNLKIQLSAIEETGNIKQISTRINPNCPNGCGKHPDKSIDLRDFKCPETFLYSKLALEKLRSESSNTTLVEIKFGAVEELENVQHSLSQEGYINSQKIICEVLNEFKLLVKINSVK